MSHFIATEVFRVNELRPSAREEARAWARAHLIPEDWHEVVLADFEAVCAALGVDVTDRSIPLYGGGYRKAPQIFFSGFSSQGDGASFSGSYRYARGSAQAIRAYAPEDTVLHSIADRLAAVQRRHLYQLEAQVHQAGRYCHEYTMAITVNRSNSSEWGIAGRDAEEIRDCLQDLARWLYRCLKREYEFQTSDEQVDMAIAANEFTFLESGRRFG